MKSVIVSFVYCFILVESIFSNPFTSYIENSAGKIYQSNSKAVELDYEEEFKIMIKCPTSSAPNELQPVGALVKKMELYVSNKEKEFSKQLEIKRDLTLNVTYINTLSAILSNNGIISINSNNLDQLNIILKITYWSRNDPEIPIEMSGLAAALDLETQSESFVILAKHYGPYLLVNLSPLAGNFSQKTLDTLAGIFNSLELISIDWPVIYSIDNREMSFTYAILSAPIFYYQTRKWYNHIDLEAVVMKDLSNSDDGTGIGIALGIIRSEKSGMLLKIGYIYQQKTENNYIFAGLSIPSLSAILASK